MVLKIQQYNKGGLLCLIHDKHKGSPDYSVSISTMTNVGFAEEPVCITSRQGLRSVVI